VKLTDFGLSSPMEFGRVYDNSGTRDYKAYEVFGDRGLEIGQGVASDCYSVAVTAYELLSGARPFVDASSDEAADPCEAVNTLRGVSKEMKSFLVSGLQRKELDRLGFADGVKEMMDHEWFRDFDFKQLENRTLKAPFLPDLSKANCEINFEDTMMPGYSNGLNKPIKPEDQAKFFGYEFSGIYEAKSQETSSKPGFILDRKNKVMTYKLESHGSNSSIATTTAVNSPHCSLPPTPATSAGSCRMELQV
jgi:serine/threonine protein kinase